jgi:hypothetical protein
MLRSGKDFRDPFACRGIKVYGTHQTGRAKLMLVENGPISHNIRRLTKVTSFRHRARVMALEILVKNVACSKIAAPQPTA